MPFTFKLSRRLALMKSSGTLVLLATLTTCEPPSRVIGPQLPTYLISTMYLVPGAATLQPAQSLRFEAYGRTSTGDSVPVNVTWTALGGAITATGIYYAGSLEGDFPAVATLVPVDALGAPSVALQRMSIVHVRSLTQLVVTPANAMLMTGGTQQFAAYGRLSNGDSVPVSVTWSATGGTISPSGLFTAGAAPGGYAVSATASGITGTATVTLSGVPVASVAVSPSVVNLAPGSMQQLSVVVKDASGNVLSGRTVTWATSSSAIATVSPSGLVTGVAVGSVTITATSEGKSATAAVTVANLPVASVRVSPNPASVYLGAGVRLVAILKDANGNLLSGRQVVWTTSNSAVATVDATGLVTGIAVGTATITATSEGQSGTASLTVSSVPVASVAVSPGTANVLVGASVQLTATTMDAAGLVLTGRVVTWVSSNSSVATVSSSGLVTGVAAGAATITATSEGKSATAAVTVANVPVASVVVSPATATVLQGATVQLVATPKDSIGNSLSGRTITWASSAPAIATVSSAGLVTGVAAGVVTISATSEGKTGSAAVTVNLVPVAAVSVTPASATVQIGQTVQLTALLTDAGGLPLTGRTVSWTSSNPAVAAVSGSSTVGVVTGIAAGTATVTATSGGISGTAAVTVTSAVVPVASVTVSPATASIVVGQVLQLTATPQDAAGNPLVGRVVTWASNAPAVATVSAAGLVTGVAVGAASVTATSEGQSGTAAITVSAPPPPGTAWPNDPYSLGTAGWTFINDYGLNAINAGGWRDVYPGSNISVVNDATAPLSPPATWQYFYPIGSTGGVSPATEYLTWSRSTDVYWGFWWKPSNPWQGHSSGVNKIVEFFDDMAPFGSYFYKMGGPVSGPFHTVVTFETDIPTVNFGENQDTTAITLGQWHRCEFLLKRSDNTLKWWLDGKLKGSYSGVHYGGTKFVQAEVYGGWGGVGDTKTENDYYWFDHVHITGTP